MTAEREPKNANGWKRFNVKFNVVFNIAIKVTVAIAIAVTLYFGFNYVKEIRYNVYETEVINIER